METMMKMNNAVKAMCDHSSVPEDTSLLMNPVIGQASADAASMGPYATPRVKNGEAPWSLETIAA